MLKFFNTFLVAEIMRKATKLKGKEKHEKRKKEKIFNFLKNHAIIYNLLIILEKYLIRNLELWEIIIKNDGYVDEEQIINVKTFLSKIKVIQKSYEEEGFEYIEQAYIELEKTFNEVVEQYKINDIESLNKEEIELIQITIRIFAIVDAIKQNFNKINDKLKLKLIESFDNFQNYIDFFKNEIDKCKAKVIFKD